ncbi:MAG: methylmalonyl-CoA mutase family protein, partial [bacterium]
MSTEKTKFEQERERWERTTAAQFKDRPAKFMTTSSEPINELYGPEDMQHIDYFRDISFPGEFPYTRGIHANMYRGRLWTMRQFAGFGT